MGRTALLAWRKLRGSTGRHGDIQLHGDSHAHLLLLLLFRLLIVVLDLLNLVLITLSLLLLRDLLLQWCMTQDAPKGRRW